MNYGELLYEVPNELRRLYRALERQKRKMITIKWSCTFNEVCLKEYYNRVMHNKKFQQNIIIKIFEILK